MSKSLGQIACEAYGNSLAKHYSDDDYDLVPWEDIDEPEKSVWEDVAKAVSDAVKPTFDPGEACK